MEKSYFITEKTDKSGSTETTFTRKPNLKIVASGAIISAIVFLISLILGSLDILSLYNCFITEYSFIFMILLFAIEIMIILNKKEIVSDKAFNQIWIVIFLADVGAVLFCEGFHLGVNSQIIVDTFGDQLANFFVIMTLLFSLVIATALAVGIKELVF